MQTDFKSVPSRQSSEPSRFPETAGRDWLTGLYNRHAVEEILSTLPSAEAHGLVFLISVTNIGQLNNRYGHLIGDHILKEIARILGFLFSRKELIGRLEGDEFLVFAPGGDSPELLKSKIQQLKSRFRSISLPGGPSCRLTVSVSGEAIKPGDTYRTIMDRIDARRLEAQELSASASSSRESGPGDPPGVIVDLKHIQQELSEQELLPGAYCQDYESFKNIYRFVARGLRRSGREAFTILITLTDEFGNFISLSCREAQMQLLGTLIQNSLRIGDVYTQYSSCQYLIMVLDASVENANMIGLRIRDAFLKATEIPERLCLLHAVYPMEEIRRK